MTSYEIAKHIHMLCAVLSISGFMLRGFWMMRSSPLLFLKPVKILPHIIDTVLLASAFYLAFLLHLSPHNQPWLAAKIVGLIVYIALGLVALRFGKTKPIRMMAFVFAVLTFFYIGVTAMSKNPTWFL